MTTSRRFRCRIGLGRVPGSASVRIPWTLLLVLEFRKISIIELKLLLRQAPRRPRRGSPGFGLRSAAGSSCSWASALPHRCCPTTKSINLKALGPVRFARGCALADRSLDFAPATVLSQPWLRAPRVK